MSRYKILNNGRTVEGLPATAVLEDGAAPAAVADAVASWREAVAALKEPREALQAAEAAARESTLQVRGERERWSAEIREKTAAEADALRAAERVSTAAARSLVGVLEEHGATLRAVAARLALAAHVEAIGAALDLEDARARFRVGPNVGTHPLVDDVLLSRSRRGVIPETSLDDLDRVNVAALAKISGEDPSTFGFVEVVSRSRMVPLWTIPARAERLGKALGVNDWTTRADLEAAA